MSTWCGPASAGATATAAALACACGSGSRIRALRPRPSAFLAIGDDLLCKLNIAFCPSTMYVVEEDWLPVARGLGQAHVSRNDRREYLGTEEAAQIRRDLA